MNLGYQELPPAPFLRQVHLHCPKAAGLYDYLWSRQDDRNTVRMPKEDIAFISRLDDFRDNLRRLNLEGLISYVKKEDCYVIELVTWEDVDECS